MCRKYGLIIYTFLCHSKRGKSLKKQKGDNFGNHFKKQKGDNFGDHFNKQREITLVISFV